MLLTLIAPEWLVAKELDEYFVARKCMEELLECADMDGIEQSLAHCYFANMGEFGPRAEMPCFNTSFNSIAKAMVGSCGSREQLRHDKTRRLSSLDQYQAINEDAKPQGKTLIINTRQILETRKGVLITKLLSISMTDTEVKSKRIFCERHRTDTSPMTHHASCGTRP